MKIKTLDGQKIEELSMIEVAHALLEQNAEEMSFQEIYAGVQDYLSKSDDEMKAAIGRFYTELNTDGSFIPLGDHKWALRSWYAIDAINEETISLDYFDDDVIDDAAIDPSLISDEEDEAEYNGKAVVEDISYDENPDDEQDETEAYDQELAEVDVDADEIPEGEVAIHGEDEDLDDDEE